MSTQAPKQELVPAAIDTRAAGALAVSGEAGGLAFKSMEEVMNVAKLMAVSGEAVPKHCRNRPGVCLGIVIQAVEWRLSPYAVANKSYVVNDRLGWESQLVHAVLEQRAPITSRLRHSYSGEGAKRKCKIWATAKGEDEPLVYESPEIGMIKVKNSPLWQSNPDLQLYYSASRDFARMYFPDVLLGVYADDELDAFVGDVDAKVGSLSGPPSASRAEHLRRQIEAEKAAPQFTGDPAVDVPPLTDEDTRIDAATVPLEATAEESAAKGPKPPIIPKHLADYGVAIFDAKTEADVLAAFESHINSNGQLSEEDHTTGCELRDWKLHKLKSADPTKGKKELFEKGSDQYE
jgi:hypothetical protein